MTNDKSSKNNSFLDEGEEEAVKPTQVKESLKDKLVRFGSSLLGHILKTSITLVLYIGILFFATHLMKDTFFPELKTLRQIEDGYKAITKTHEAWILKMNAFEDKFGQLDSLKKDLEDLKTDANGKIQGIYDWMKSQNMPDAEAVTMQSPEGEKAKKELLDGLNGKMNLREVIENIKKKPMREPFKVLVESVAEVDTENLLDKEALIKKFDVLLTASGQEKADDGSLKGLSAKFIQQIKKNIKVSVNGKETALTLKEILEKSKKALAQNDLQTAISELESVQDVDDIESWIKFAKTRILVDGVIQKIQDFKGPYFE